jgi:hypothetical protein
MSHPCGCLGGNQNCTFCYGSGYLEGDRLPLSYDRIAWGPIKNSDPGSLRPRRQLGTVKPNNSKPGKPAGAHSPIGKVQRPVRTERVAAPLQKPSKPSVRKHLLVICPKCPRPVQEDRLMRHLDQTTRSYARNAKVREAESVGICKENHCVATPNWESIKGTRH